MSCSTLASYSFEIRKGDDKTVKFKYFAAGVPVDLTGSVIQFECAEPSLSRDCIIDDAVNGEFSLTFVQADTVDLLNHRVRYEVVRWPSGLAGNKVTIFQGTVLLSEEIAK